MLGITVVDICHGGAGYDSCKNFVTEVMGITVVRTLSQIKRCWVWQLYECVTEVLGMAVVQICHRGAVYVIRKNFVREVLCMTVVRTLSQVLVMTFKEFVTEVLGMTVVRVWHRGAGLGYDSCKNLSQRCWVCQS